LGSTSLCYVHRKQWFHFSVDEARTLTLRGHYSSRYGFEIREDVKIQVIVHGGVLGLTTEDGKEGRKNRLHHVGPVIHNSQSFLPQASLQLSEPLKSPSPSCSKKKKSLPLLYTHERKLPRTHPPLDLEASPWDTEPRRRSRGDQRNRRARKQEAGSHGVPPS
jgi:hypothetical protein